MQAALDKNEQLQFWVGALFGAAAFPLVVPGLEPVPAPPAAESAGAFAEASGLFAEVDGEAEGLTPEVESGAGAGATTEGADGVAVWGSAGAGELVDAGDSVSPLEGADLVGLTYAGRNLS